MNCDRFRTGWGSSSRSLTVEAHTENSALLRNPSGAVLSWWTSTLDTQQSEKSMFICFDKNKTSLKISGIRCRLTHSSFEGGWEMLVPRTATFVLARIACCPAGGQTGHRWCASYAGLGSGPGAPCGDYWGTDGSRFCCRWLTCTRCACCSGSGCTSDEHKG